MPLFDSEKGKNGHFKKLTRYQIKNRKGTENEIRRFCFLGHFMMSRVLLRLLQRLPRHQQLLPQQQPLLLPRLLHLLLLLLRLPRPQRQRQQHPQRQQKRLLIPQRNHLPLQSPRSNQLLRPVPLRQRHQKQL